jgi:PIN domain nuclease of toxin-antitoxin system
MTGTGRPSRRQAVVNTERRARQRERTKQEIYDEAYRRKASAISAKETQQTEFAAFRSKTRQAVRNRMSQQAVTRESVINPSTYDTSFSQTVSVPKIHKDRFDRLDKRIKDRKPMQIAGFNLNVFGK